MVRRQKLKSENLKRNSVKSIQKLELNENKQIEYTKKRIIISIRSELMQEMSVAV